MYKIEILKSQKIYSAIIEDLMDAIEIAQDYALQGYQGAILNACNEVVYDICDLQVMELEW